MYPSVTSEQYAHKYCDKNCSHVVCCGDTDYISCGMLHLHYSSCGLRGER